MVFTSVSRLGDFLLTLPVVSWHYKNTGEKAHFVLSDNFPLYKKAERLVRMQEFTEEITYVNVGTDAFRDWEFDPSWFGINGKYVNFGFYPNVRLQDYYMPDLHAEHHKMGVDYDFRLNIGDNSPLVHDKNYTVWVEASPWRSELGRLRSIIPAGCMELTGDFVDDAVIAKHAKTVYSTMGGFMVIMDLCRIPCNVYGDAGIIGDKKMFYKTEHNYFVI